LVELNLSTLVPLLRFPYFFLSDCSFTIVQKRRNKRPGKTFKKVSNCVLSSKMPKNGRRVKLFDKIVNGRHPTNQRRVLSITLLIKPSQLRLQGIPPATLKLPFNGQ
jgi:hypothetical protein